MEHLGEILKKYRQKEDLTQEAMAKLIETGLRTYLAIEKTGKVAKTKTLQAIKQLGIDTRKIAEKDDEKKSFLFTGRRKLTVDDYIALQEKHNAFLEKMLEVGLSTILNSLGALHDHDLAYHQTALRSLARLEKQKDQNVLILEADNVEADFLTGNVNEGNQRLVRNRKHKAEGS
jgi:DNA-binding XRE family transcriptional regulator